MTDKAATPVQRYQVRNAPYITVIYDTIENKQMLVSDVCQMLNDHQAALAAANERAEQWKEVFDRQCDDVAYLKQQLAAARAEAVALREAIEWALGCSGDFVVRKRGEGPFWWRKELRERALAAVPPQPTPGGE